jgi:ribonuclease E
MATFIMNEKRDFINNIEKRHGVHILVISNPYLLSPQYTISRLKEDNVGKNKKPSYTLIQQPDLDIERAGHQTVQTNEPAVKAYEGQSPVKRKKAGLFETLWGMISGRVDDASNEKKQPLKSQQLNELAPKTRTHQMDKRNHPNRKRHSNQNATSPSQPRTAAQTGRKKAPSAQAKGRVIPIKPEQTTKKTALPQENNGHEDI